MRLAALDGVFGRIEDDHLIPMGPDLAAYLETGESRDGEPVPFDGRALRAPIPRPGKIVCVGLNYRDHAAESGQPIPEEPILFPKFANSVISPGEQIEVPSFVEHCDYEAELGVVIGRTAKGVAPAQALEHVAGYMCLNDISARDLQFRSTQWMLGKAIDGFLPSGPWLVTADEVPDPQRLGVRCTVNG
ncbi:MAG: fumarylacetoacetate hydrolase family protein, partial [Actinomycetota bacterium]|nr:fumarylacetoacetate hydrolase family protein [Actinomycetota bacterium]